VTDEEVAHADAVGDATGPDRASVTQPVGNERIGLGRRGVTPVPALAPRWVRQRDATSTVAPVIATGLTGSIRVTVLDDAPVEVAAQPGVAEARCLRRVLRPGEDLAEIALGGTLGAIALRGARTAWPVPWHVPDRLGVVIRTVLRLRQPRWLGHRPTSHITR
jgi:hypothetical protein